MNDTLILYFFLCFKYLNTCRNKGVGLFHSTRDKNILKMRITNKIKMKKGPVVYILSYSDERSGLARYLYGDSNFSVAIYLLKFPLAVIKG